MKKDTNCTHCPLQTNLYDMLVELVICCDESGEIGYANPAAQRWCQTSLIGQPFSVLLVPEVRPKGQAFFEKACAATPQHPTPPWELVIGHEQAYIVATFRGYKEQSCVFLTAQIETLHENDIHIKMEELTSELVEMQRQLRRQNRTLRQRSEEQIKAYQLELTYQKLALDEHCIVCTVNDRGNITYVNEKFCQMSQYQPQELLGKDLSIVDSGFHSRSFLRTIVWRVARGNVWHGELIKRKKGGSLYVVEATIVPFLTQQGRPYQYVFICTDITALKQTKEFEHDRSLVLEMIARDQVLPDILEQIVLMIEHQRPEVKCALFLLNKGVLSCQASIGLPDRMIQTLNTIPAPPELCSTNSAVYRQESVLVRDIATDQVSSRCRDTALEAGLRGCWSVPIVSRDGEVLGIIATYHHDLKNPSPNEVVLADAASSLAAIAIEQQLLAERLSYQAYNDVVTGLPNRFLFEDRLAHALVQAEQQEQMVAVLFADLDRFKQVNNTLGHTTGDMVLQQVARRLEQHVRMGDTLARMSGDEFSLILTDIHTPQEAVQTAQVLLETLEIPFHVDTHKLFVSASIGISIYPTDGKDVATLQRNADIALYRAKSRASGNVQCFTPEMNEAMQRQVEIESDLRQALERGELFLHFQPQVDLGGNLIGVEALLRWKNPVLGMISPSVFIPMAEESGLIIPIGTWVLHEACRQAKRWQRAGFRPFKVAINVSAVQLAQTDFVEVVADALNVHGLDPQWLEIELTESVLMRNYDYLADQLHRLRTLGLGIAIDDFGTGYSSLSHLQRLPIDTLKIDQSFVHGIGLQSSVTVNGLAIIKAITVLAHTLHMTVVAEGVETTEQLALLSSVDCDWVQGRLLSSSLPVDELETKLALMNGSKPLFPVRHMLESSAHSGGLLPAPENVSTLV